MGNLSNGGLFVCGRGMKREEIPADSVSVAA